MKNARNRQHRNLMQSARSLHSRDLLL